MEQEAVCLVREYVSYKTKHGEELVVDLSLGSLGDVWVEIRKGLVREDALTDNSGQLRHD